MSFTCSDSVFFFFGVYLLLTCHALLQGFHGSVTCLGLENVYKEGKMFCPGYNLVIFFSPCKLVGLLAICLVQVVIEGFKSYKEEISTEPFSPKVNVVGKPPLLLPRSQILL
jgi:hypothetical protein